ncbi:MAG: hypothetical protein K1X74_19935 [Pirellulales bacterium]|nr:hypothetical protein [Pirellulales bacterium]
MKFALAWFAIALSVSLAPAAPADTYLAWTVEPTTAKAPEGQGTRLAASDWQPLAAAEPLAPYAEMTSGVRAADGSLWIGTPRGLMYLAAGAPRWRLFHSRCWLPDDRIERVSVVAGSATMPWDLYVQTAQGAVRLAQRPTSLADKMARYLEQLRKHHVREGLITEIVLSEPGNLASSAVQPDNDNDGLWTSLYVAAESYRFATTGDPDARRNAQQSLAALMRLESITGIPGFAARSFVPISIDKSHGPGEWHRSADGHYWWKGDTSSDELDGHYYAYAIYHDLVADAQERQQIAGVVGRITDHILDHGYYYVGPPGKPTTWGVWAPEKLNRDLEWIGDRGLNSLEILSHLKVAEHVTGKARYTDAARELAEKHAYDINTVEQKVIWPPEAVNHSDDELAFISYHPLLMYERDERLRHIYMTSLRRSWQIERPEESPLFNYIYAAARQANRWTDPLKRPDKAILEPAAYDGEACLRWFQEIPENLFNWSVENSQRRDLGNVARNRFDEPRSLQVLPISERRLMRWNGDPYSLDSGGDGRVREDGTFILLPYWMGRYHRFLE